ncbi:MAG: IS630 family transposase [Pseudomonadales bacterium]|nr:IS630 family transposase [Pseudomonadales bacterium]|tara:strand:- start:203 stop:1276 length:1074 start_codon:yes stop_codon:yes gene_type:complete
MRKPKPFQISSETVSTLNELCRSTTLPHGQIMRAKIILQLSEGMTPTQVAEAQRTSPKTVHRWRNRFEAEGLDGLLERPRSGRPTVIDKGVVDRVLYLTTKCVPEEATHWSIELMAKYAEVTPWQVRQIWAAADLRPHRLKTFKISNDPEFADKVVDIVGLYMNPPENAVVLSVDEKTQIQALDRTQPGLPLNPSRIGSRTHDYKRHGTTSLFAAFNTLTGKVIGKVSNRTNSKEFLSFLKLVNRRTNPDKDLHIILDNLSAHKTKEVRDWVDAHPRIHLHFTPTSSSWLNAVEGWFALLERRALYRGVFTSVSELKMELENFIKVHNAETAKPFKWTKPASQILASVERAKKKLQN